jgi:hypothetical protein
MTQPTITDNLPLKTIQINENKLFEFWDGTLLELMLRDYDVKVIVHRKSIDKTVIYSECFDSAEKHGMPLPTEFNGGDEMFHETIYCAAEMTVSRNLGKTTSKYSNYGNIEFIFANENMAMRVTYYDGQTMHKFDLIILHRYEKLNEHNDLLRYLKVEKYCGKLEHGVNVELMYRPYDSIFTISVHVPHPPFPNAYFKQSYDRTFAIHPNNIESSQDIFNKIKKYVTEIDASGFYNHSKIRTGCMRDANNWILCVNIDYGMTTGFALNLPLVIPNANVPPKLIQHANKFKYRMPDKETVIDSYIDGNTVVVCATIDNKHFIRVFTQGNIPNDLTAQNFFNLLSKIATLTETPRMYSKNYGKFLVQYAHDTVYLSASYHDGLVFDFDLELPHNMLFADIGKHFSNFI